MDSEIEDYMFDINMPLYVPQRFSHKNCSENKDNCLIITRYPSHFKWYCHRCEKAGLHRIENIPPGDIVNMWKADQIYKDKPEQSPKEIRLPMDFTNDIKTYSAAAYAWLLKYSITDEEIVKYNIGYSPHYKRVIFPVYQDCKLVYWQGRTLDEVTKRNPKWLNIKEQGRANIYFYAGYTRDSIVLVEDIISAIKVGRVIKSIALLGSYIPDSLILTLKDFKVYIWLDEDKKAEAVKYYLRLQSHSIRVWLRVTKEDPKYYTEEEIEEVLYGDQKT